jgi:hypothetical protein
MDGSYIGWTCNQHHIFVSQLSYSLTIRKYSAMSDFRLRDVPPSSRLVWENRFARHGTTSKANSYLRRQESTASSVERATSNTDTSSASTTSAADAKPTMINAPAQIGLIMPNPGSKVYTGEQLPLTTFFRTLNA